MIKYQWRKNLSNMMVEISGEIVEYLCKVKEVNVHILAEEIIIVY